MTCENNVHRRAIQDGGGPVQCPDCGEWLRAVDGFSIGWPRAEEPKSIPTVDLPIAIERGHDGEPERIVVYDGLFGGDRVQLADGRRGFFRGQEDRDVAGDRLGPVIVRLGDNPHSGQDVEVPLDQVRRAP